MTASSCGDRIIYKFIITSISVTLTQVIYNVHSSTWPKYDVNLYHPQAFVLEQNPVFQVSPYFVFSGLFLDGLQLLVHFHPAVSIVQSCTQIGCFWSSSRFFFCQQTFQEDLSAFLARVSGSAASYEFKFRDAQNLTCLQPVPNAFYTNYNNLKQHSFWPV